MGQVTNQLQCNLTNLSSNFISEVKSKNKIMSKRHNALLSFRRHNLADIEFNTSVYNVAAFNVVTSCPGCLLDFLDPSSDK